MAVLDQEAIDSRLGDLDGWSQSGGSIRKAFRQGNFKGSVDFVNRLTPPAEEMNHHPDLAISWDTVTVSLSTHSEGGLTESDFELAAKIDSVA